MSETQADITYPPDPFAHGSCREIDCSQPAVIPDGLCADHYAALLPAGATETAERAPAPRHHTSNALSRRRATQRKRAAASKRRNRK